MKQRFRTGLYYFSQFWSGGAFHSYGGIWFASLGFTATQIGLTNTVPTLIVLVTNILIGKIADRAKDWRHVLIILSAISAVAACGLIFVRDYYAVFFFWSVALMGQTFAVPIGDGAATYLQREGRGSIGTARALSTTGYLLSLFATGYAIQGLGGGIFAALFAGFSVFRAFAAALLPPFKSEALSQPAGPHGGVSQFLQPWLLLPLLGWSIVYATIQVLNSFFALILKEQGIGTSTISWIIGWGALTEALVFLAFNRLSHLLSLRSWVVISCGVTAVRWFVMAHAPGLALLFLLQSLHGICYALGFVACATYIAKRTSPAIAAEAQSAFGAMQMIAAVIIVTAFGGIFQSYGVKAFYASAAVALLGTLIAAASLVIKPPDTK